MKNIIKKIINRVVRRWGYELGKSVSHFQKNDLLFTFFNNLKQIGFEPKHIVDVGANHGTWTRETLKYFPDAYYTLLEPQYWMQDSIKDLLENNKKIKFNAVGAGAQEGTFNFTIVNRDDSCSFRYTEAEAKAEGFEQIEVPVVTLNNLLAQSNLPTPDIIKIDAEGLDIEVLKGTSNYFGQTEIFMVEVGIVNKLFDNSFLTMVNYMDSNGYTLFDITDLNRPFTPAVLWLAELVFVKKNGYIDTKTYV
ncbi:MAG: FkbM family methyltransferase [Sphingobacteriaceae bacterium]|nr:MAG: FkbM family methyltransferase [Sphingobacteriaceae bacterium]